MKVIVIKHLITMMEKDSDSVDISDWTKDIPNWTPSTDHDIENKQVDVNFWKSSSSVSTIIDNLLTMLYR